MMPLTQLDLSVDRTSDLPVGAQLAGHMRAAIAEGRLAAGERMPSVRALAEAAGVNVNTARAVYQRLENERLVRSEQGKGTFVAGGDAAPVEPVDDAAVRRELHGRIADLEAQLVRHRPLTATAPESRSTGGRLLTTAELTAVVDGLRDRMRELDSERAEVLQRLEQLREAQGAVQPQPAAPRRSSVSLRGARVRWIGA